MYLVTGASGFIGKHLLDALVRRGQPIHCLVRPSSVDRFRDLIDERWPSARSQILVLPGDVGSPHCGLSANTIEELGDTVKHMFHLAALYDMTAGLEESQAANVDGTRNACRLAEALGATLHYASSTAVAGDYKGFFREDMFDEGQKHKSPYFRTKFLAEKLVRDECQAPYRIYRPGAVIGSSVNGEADKIDGIYYSFKLIQRMRRMLPSWVPLIGFEGSELHVVPVDYVARAMDAIAHNDEVRSNTFHLTDPKPHTFGDAMNLICKAAHAPQFSARVDPKVLKVVPPGLAALLGAMPAVKTARREFLADIGIPESVLPFVNWRSSFDTRETEAALAPSGIQCPRLEDYAWKIWDYWERHMDPDLFQDRSLHGRIAGKVAMVTGASSGIGEALAIRLAEAGAKVLLVARSREKLEAVQQAIDRCGGEALIHTADLSNPEDADRLVREVLAEYGCVDLLVNNAGRSIRRGISHSYDRYHDFERTMSLNYFGSLKLILGLLPAMRARKSGQIINISSIGVQTNAPRFSAYVASKAALDAFSRSIASEVVADGVCITTVYMPLVRTPMIAPTKIYDAIPTRSPDEAVDMIVDGIVNRKKRVATRLGIFGEVSYALAPKLIDRVLNTGFRLFPDSPRKGEDQDHKPPGPEAVAFAHLMKGIHW
ncbi:MAG: SDR family oxidoreductase [Deltaproteobacteria bacterium]|nr:SDR family oxidoreductase [Deltaproteobacteria bacterium]